MFNTHAKSLNSRPFDLSKPNFFNSTSRGSWFPSAWPEICYIPVPGVQIPNLDKGMRENIHSPNSLPTSTTFVINCNPPSHSTKPHHVVQRTSFHGFPNAQPTMVQDNITSPLLPVETEKHVLANPDFNLLAETELPLSSSAQKFNVPAGPRTIRIVLAAKALDRSAGTMDRTAGALELTEFTLFPKLAPELRLKIWKDALPDPRIVEIEWCYDEKKWFCPIESQSTPSGLIRANKESSKVYLKVYIPLSKHGSVGTSKGIPGRRHYCTRKISLTATASFDPTIDLLYIGPSAGSHLCISTGAIEPLSRMPWMENIQTLACEFRECKSGLGSFIEDKDDLPFAYIPHLKELIIIVRDVTEGDMQQTNPKWRNRPPGELEFVERGISPSHRASDEWFFDRWYNIIPQIERPKLIVKRALRGGVTPGVVTGYRDGHVSEAKEETEE